MSDPESQQPKTTREQLMRELAIYQENGDNMPLVRDVSLLRPGDLLHLVDTFDSRPFKQVMVMGLTEHADDQGQQRTFVTGIEADLQSYHEYTNNPDRMEEFAALTGQIPQSAIDMARITTAMTTDLVVTENPDLPIVEEEARSIGLMPYEDGRFHPSVATFLSTAAEATQ